MQTGLHHHRFSLHSTSTCAALLIACHALQLEDAAEARIEAQRLVQQLRKELGAKQAAVARVEQEVAPALREAQQAEAEVKAASVPHGKRGCAMLGRSMEGILGRL